mmetsp:Transcript_17599/g.21214  ORF Transcript_17599/g.21214 Transcript_17599/m.21214 type:complete len:93 (+) Transcript_17599:134-412(+)
MEILLFLMKWFDPSHVNFCEDQNVNAFILVQLMVMLLVVMAQHDRWQPLGLEVFEFQADTLTAETLIAESNPMIHSRSSQDVKALGMLAPAA